MRRLISGFVASLTASALLAIVFGAAALRAQMQPVGGFIQAGGYIGPGDIISFTAWGSCMFGYSHAYSLPGTNSACDLSLQTNGATIQISTCTLPVGTNGLADWDKATPCPGGLTVNQWSANALGPPNLNGNTAVGTGSASGFVLTITGGCTGTFKTGYEIQTGHYITSLGTGTGCAGTYNLNVSTSIGSGTITGNPPRLMVQKIYDQTGNNACSAASCDLVQNTLTSQPFICPEVTGLTTCSGIPKGMIYQVNTLRVIQTANIYAASSPLGISVVSNILAGGIPLIFKAGGAGSGSTLSNAIYEFTASTNLWSCNGSAFTVSAADGAFHAGNCQMIDNPSTSTFNVDGTVATATQMVDTSTVSANPRISGRNSGGPQFYVGEVGWKAGDMTSLLEAVCKNQHKRYGGTLLPGTC